jgi:hypothetical protein
MAAVHPDHEPPVEIGTRHGKRPHALPLTLQPVDRPLAQRAVQPNVRALIEPAVQLILKVQLVDERPARLEAGLDEPLQTLADALRLAGPGIEDPPADRQLPAEAGELLRRSPATGVQTPSRSTTSRLGSAPIRHTHRRIPHNTSGAALENTSAQAPNRA